jgi:putative ABC transport system permease protein
LPAKIVKPGIMLSRWLIAWRSLRRRPAFFAATLLILALGIGASTAVFSVVDATLLKPLPYANPDRLVVVMEGSPKTGREGLIAPARIEDWNRMNRTFEAISGLYSENLTDSSGSEPERLAGRRVAPRFFQVLQSPPALGRYFTAEEDRENGPNSAVIGYRLWTRRYQQSQTVLGSRLVLGGKGYTIVGVSLASFADPTVDLWLPAQIPPFLMRIREARFFSGVGRMKPGVTVAQAQADLAAVENQLGEQFPASDRGWSAVVGDLKEARVGNFRRGLFLVLGAVVLLFLIAIANTAALSLTQVMRRSGEFAIRGALGANRWQIAGGVLRESAIVAALSATGGAALAALLLRLLRSRLADLPRPAEIVLDWRALAVATFAGCVAALLCGLVPVIQATRRSSPALLASSGRGNSGERHRWQGALAMAQIALTFLLLSGAGLMLRTYQNLSHSDPGFQTSHAVAFHVGAAWTEDRQRIGLMQETLLDKFNALPGVEAAGFANFLPASGATLRYQFTFGNEPAVTAGERSVTRDYFKAVGTPVVAGESCPDLRAIAAAPQKALVNLRFVKQYLNDQNPVGRTFTMSDVKKPFEITGVVADSREDALNTAPVPYVYICIVPGGWPDPEYVVRTAGDPAPLLRAIRAAIHEVEPTRAVFKLNTLADRVDATLDQPRLDAQMIGFFALSALLLASVGIYSLVTLIVISGTREIGVRMALGAGPGEIVRQIAVGVARLLFAGMAVGLVATILAGRALESLLFGVHALDPATLVLTLLTVTTATLVAILLPARRAARVDPVIAIRAE